VAHCPIFVNSQLPNLQEQGAEYVGRKGLEARGKNLHYLNIYNFNHFMNKIKYYCASFAKKADTFIMPSQ
jgi:hypothetical protein